jgi:hypothetical protein
VRGWARYRGRLTARSVRPTTFRRPLPPREASAEASPATRIYTSEQGVDRYAFLRAVQAKLAQEGWEWKTDLGWEDYDLEIHGRRWSRVRLATVMEWLDAEHRVLHCRTRAAWSMAAGLGLGALIIAVLVVCGLLDARQPWIWLLALALPLFAALIEHERRLVHRLVLALIDEVARESGLMPPVAPAGRRGPGRGSAEGD